MATLTVDSPRAYSLGDLSDYPVLTNTDILEGCAVGLQQSTGYVRKLTAGDKFLGFCTQRANNNPGASGAINVRTRVRGAMQISVSGAVIQDVSQPVYMSTDNDFSFIPTSNSFVGFVRRFISSGVVILDFDAFNFVDPFGTNPRETLTDNKTLDAEDSGKVFFVNADAKTITFPSIEGLSGITVVNIGAYGTIAVTIDLGSNDMLEGADITAADGKGIINTKATANRGDLIEIDYSDANGYVARRRLGTWARET